MNGGLYWSLIALLAAGLAVAVVTDWRRREIPDWLNIAIALGAIPFWAVSGVQLWPDVPIHVALAAGVFALFACAFMIGQMGGGDVKLLGALALWLPWHALVQLLVIMSVAGGVLTLALVIPHRLAKRTAALEIPYGIAIAFAGFWLIGERILNQFV
jgi:prepilin peptidase CpaA